MTKAGEKTLRIERARIEDAPVILALQNLAYQSEAEIYNDYSIQPLTQTLEDLIDEFKTHNVFKAIKGEHLVGSVRIKVNNGTCYVGKLIVHPDHQNQGIGSMLMAYVENQNNSIRRMELFTGHKSIRNILLYKKLGYKEFNRKRINADIVHVFMEKQLDAT